MNKILSAGILLILFLTLSILLAINANSHEWYDIDCCDKKDCVSTIKVEEYKDFTRYYYIWQKKEDFIDVPLEWEKNNKDRVRPSKDSLHHVCVIYVEDPDGTRGKDLYKFIRCVYKPMMF